MEHSGLPSTIMPLSGVTLTIDLLIQIPDQYITRPRAAATYLT